MPVINSLDIEKRQADLPAPFTTVLPPITPTPAIPVPGDDNDKATTLTSSPPTTQPGTRTTVAKTSETTQRSAALPKSSATTSSSSASTNKSTATSSTVASPLTTTVVKSAEDTSVHSLICTSSLYLPKANRSEVGRVYAILMVRPKFLPGGFSYTNRQAPTQGLIREGLRFSQTKRVSR